MTQPYPSAPSERAEARQKIIDRVLDKARQEARELHRSLRCRAGDHHRLHDGYRVGCANDGTTCICDCHDREEPTDG